MRVLEFVLLLASCADYFNFERSDTNGRPKALSEKRRRNSIEIDSFENEAIEEELALTAQQTKELEERLMLRENRTTNERLKPWRSSIEEINAEAGVVNNLYQGDVVPSRERQEGILANIKVGRFKRQAYRDTSYPGRRWPNGVFYIYDCDLPNKTRELFETAARLWMENTCINFKEDKEQEAEDLILVISGKGCWSDVGRQGDWQLLSLGDTCDRIGHAAHEIGHALGFWHTHQRYDRNQFVEVFMKNIEHNQRYQYEKETRKTNNNYNLTYDYGSLMHYSSTSFIIKEAFDKGKYTIVSEDRTYMETMGSHIISFYDLLMMNLYYNCTDACKGTSTRCHNGGFVHPRKCYKCICPSGYGGRYCNRRPPGCGKVYHANRTWKTLEDKLNGSDAGPDGFVRCNYWIKAPAGKKIQVKVEELPTLYGFDGCIHAGVEIKTHPDQRRTGYRFCKNSSIGTTLTSNSNTVPVITFILGSLLNVEPLPEDYYELGEEEYENNSTDKEHDTEEENQLPTSVILKYRHL